MNRLPMNRRRFSALISAGLAWMFASAWGQSLAPEDRKRRRQSGRPRRDAAEYELPPELAAYGALSLVLGRVTVSPEEVKVDYVRSYLPKDETETRKNGEVAYSYAVSAKGGR